MDRDRRGALLVICAFAFIVAYEIISTIGITKRWLLELNRILPTWVPLASLIATPVVGAVLGLRRFRHTPVQTAALLVMLLLVFSLASLAELGHPVAFFIMLGVFLGDAYWVIPRVNRRTAKKRDFGSK